MTHLQIEYTIKGSTRPSKRQYKIKQTAMDAWDTAVDSAIGGDNMRLIDLETGRVLSEYHPVDSARPTNNGSW